MTASYEARCHFLHLRREKNKEMTMNQANLWSFATFEKKNKNEKKENKIKG